MGKIPDSTHILAGDVGGTKTNLAIIRLLEDSTGEEMIIEQSARFPSGSHPSLNAIIREFLAKLPRHVRLACAGFGVPGPVEDGRAKPTNLSWGVDASEIADEFSIPRVGVINDLAANALGIAELKSSDFSTLVEGDPNAKGNRCVVSPGTGLGEAGLFWDGKRHRVWACEGGHTDFAPRNDIEIALLQYLKKLYGHVSGERVISGMGIQNIYKFLRETGRGKELPEVALAFKTRDHGVVISEFADTGKCPMCVETLEIFVGCLASECGNMALKSMALGGVFLGGGIPAKMISHLQGVGFQHAFTNKGRLSPLLEKIPVRVILNDQAALLGAARHAVDILPG